MNRPPLEVGEWYHCYSRGVDKRRVFTSPRDYLRFLALMYVANCSSSIHLSNIVFQSFDELIQHPAVIKLRTDRITEIGAYALMSNHAHFLLKETKEGGIANFMQKVFTGYTMYFNKKNKRTGALFSGTYKSKHIDDDAYLQHVVGYIHLNPAEIFDASWKEGKGDVGYIDEKISSYPYSSLHAYSNVAASQRAILGDEIFELYTMPDSHDMVREAQEYYLYAFNERDLEDDD